MNLTASLTQVLRIDDATQVGHARRVVQKLAEQQGFDATDAGRAAIVATELASNVLKHAARGELHLRVLAHGGQPGIELLAVRVPHRHGIERAHRRPGAAHRGTEMRHRRFQIIHDHAETGGIFDRCPVSHKFHSDFL